MGRDSKLTHIGKAWGDTSEAENSIQSQMCRNAPVCPTLLHERKDVGSLHSTFCCLCVQVMTFEQAERARFNPFDLTKVMYI
jgi:hypothetical protein